VYMLVIGLLMIIMVLSVNALSASALPPTSTIDVYLSFKPRFISYRNRKILFTAFGFIASRSLGGILILPPSTSAGIGYTIGWFWRFLMKP